MTVEPSQIGKMSIQCVEDSLRWFPDSAPSLMHHTVGLAGEVGEFANIVKKIDRGSLKYEEAVVRHDLAMELTDVLIYVLNIAGLLRVDLARSYEVKRLENEQRFGKKAEANG